MCSCYYWLAVNSEWNWWHQNFLLHTVHVCDNRYLKVASLKASETLPCWLCYILQQTYISTVHTPNFNQTSILAAPKYFLSNLYFFELLQYPLFYSKDLLLYFFALLSSISLLFCDPNYIFCHHWWYCTAPRLYFSLYACTMYCTMYCCTFITTIIYVQGLSQGVVHCKIPLIIIALNQDYFSHACTVQCQLYFQTIFYVTTDNIALHQTIFFS